MTEASVTAEPLTFDPGTTDGEPDAHAPTNTHLDVSDVAALMLLINERPFRVFSYF